MGDGILIYFGYPRAYEDDAERGANREAVSLLDAALQICLRGGVLPADPLNHGIVSAGTDLGTGAVGCDQPSQRTESKPASQRA